jgi:integrase
MSADYTTIAVILYKYQKLANGEYPLMLRVTKNRVRKYKSLGISCKLNEWDFKSNLPKKGHPDKGRIDSIISKTIAKHKAKVMEFKDEEKDFTPNVLVAATTKGIKNITVFDYFQKKIDDLTESGQVGNANVYEATLVQLRTHNPLAPKAPKRTQEQINKAQSDRIKQKLAAEKSGIPIERVKDKYPFTFSQVDFEFLANLETRFRSTGQMDNSISIKFRTLRALYNLAILEGYARKEQYPFEEFKISSRFNSRTEKRAIPKTEFKKVEAYEPKSDMSFEAKMYFIFCYYGQGINFVDIANLQWKNIQNGRVHYRRSKSKALISFALNQHSQEIIDYCRPITFKDNESYVFNVLNAEQHNTETKKLHRIKKVLSRVNKGLKAIGTELNIQTALTSYVARHTFATVLKDSGVHTAIISESMGHKTEAITKTYLKNFPDTTIDEAMKNLL